MHAFVTGATGGIGSALCEKLSADGWSVSALVRPGSQTRYIAGLDGVSIVTCDLLDPGALTVHMHGADAVFHLAAVVHSPDAAETLVEQVNVSGTQSVVNAAVAAGVAAFVFFSTVAVYPESDDVFDEASRVAPSTPYGASKLRAEGIAMSAAGSMRVTILRLPVVYGPRDRGNVRRLIEAIACGRFFIPGSGDNIKTMVAVENVVTAAVHVANDPRAAGKLYIVTDERSSTLAEIVTTIYKALGLTRAPVRIPTGFLEAAGRIADGLRKSMGLRLPLSADQIAKLAANTRYDGTQIRRELGVQMPADLETGIASAVAGFNDRQ